MWISIAKGIVERTRVVEWGWDSVFSLAWLMWLTQAPEVEPLLINRFKPLSALSQFTNNSKIWSNQCFGTMAKREAQKDKSVKNLPWFAVYHLQLNHLFWLGLRMWTVDLSTISTTEGPRRIWCEVAVTLRLEWGDFDQYGFCQMQHGIHNRHPVPWCRG